MKQIADIWVPDSDNHFHMYLNKNTGPTGKGTYHYERFLKAMDYCKNFDAAVDVGAHIGIWSINMASVFNRVLAFEPVKENYECLKKNVPSNVITEPFALGSGLIDELRIELFPDNSGKSHIAVNHGKFIEVRPLDYYDLNIDFLKIDVEGYELYVLQGAIDTLNRCKPLVVIEDGPPELSEKYGIESRAASKFLESLGAKQRMNIRHDYIFSWD